MKFTLFALTVLGALVAGTIGGGMMTSSTPLNYAFGIQGATDVLLASVPVSMPKRFGRIVTQTYTFTQTTANPSTITRITITDQKTRNGASAAITSGGIGQNTVDITFTSRRGADINSLVQIYGTAPVAAVAPAAG